MSAAISFQCRWAFLGLSGIAELFIRDLQLSRDASNQITHKLVTLSTTGSVERAQEWLTAHQVPNPEDVEIFTSYEEMLESGDFDVVYISTPHSVHFKHARAAVEQRRNVLLEKPAVMNRKQFERLGTLAKKNDVVLMEAMWTRYFPLTKYFQQHLLPQLGPVQRIIADYSVPIFGDPQLTPSSRFLNKANGSGSLLDIGVYPLTWVDLALNLTPSTLPLQVVYAETIKHDTPSDPIDDITTVILSRSDPPVTAIVTLSSSIPGSASLGLQDKLLRKKNAPSVRIQGTRAEVALPFPPIRPESLTIQYYSPDKLDKSGFETEETITKEVYGWGLWYQADVMAEAVREKQEHSEGKGHGLLIGFEGTLRVSGWLDEAKRLAGIDFDPELETVW